MFNAALSPSDNPPVSPSTDPAGQAGPDPNVTQHHPQWISDTSPVPDSTGCRAEGLLAVERPLVFTLGDSLCLHGTLFQREIYTQRASHSTDMHQVPWWKLGRGRGAGVRGGNSS